MANPPLWEWLPDWSDPITERLQWRTQIIRTYSGIEQRIKLREYPTRAIDFSYSAQADEISSLKSLIQYNGAVEWALPIWFDGQSVDTPIYQNYDLYINTVDRGFEVGGLVAIFGNNDGRRQLHRIIGMTDTWLDLETSMATNYYKGEAVIYPAKVARLPDSVRMKIFSADLYHGRIRMEIQENLTLPALTEAQHQSLPVMENKEHWVAGPGRTLERSIEVVDFGTGPREFYDETLAHDLVRNVRWLLDSREAIQYFRSWLFTRQGKLKGCWLPSWENDFELYQDSTPTDLYLWIENTAYTDTPQPSLHNRDIRIELRTGEVFYRSIISVYKYSAYTLFYIGTNFGVEIAAANLKYISLMSYSRMDSDGAEISYYTGDSAVSACTMKAVNNEL